MSPSSTPQTLPYGSWPSPITAGDIARGTTPLYFPGFAPTPDGEEVWWVEGRPQDDGRFAVVARGADGSHRDVVPTRWNVRSRIHEYGARPWTYVASAGCVFTFWDDQRLYLMPEGSNEPRPLTSAPSDAVRHMYGEPTPAPDGTSVWVVRETHRVDGDRTAVERAIVRVPLDGSAAEDDSVVTTLAGGHRFFAFPRPSRDGTRIAYIAWDHPQMPWDGTLLCVADVVDGVGSPPRLLAGSTTESVLQPEWADDDHVYAVSDRTGWWNLYRFGVDGSVQALCPREEEFAQPLWLLGFATYGVLGDGRLAVLHGVGQMALSVLDPSDGTLTDVGTGLEFGEEMQVSGSRVVNEAGSLTSSAAITVVDVANGDVDVVRRASSLEVDAAYLPDALPLTVQGPDGEVHAWVFPPRSPDAVAPEGERPPYLAFVHGGPTAHVTPRMSLLKAYFTSRGIGVIDVNYGGSTGYGREYRERLRERWGIVDVQDTVAAVAGLSEQGLADPARLGIVGGSAGGWTTLAALVFADTFACGAAYFPVTDLLPFAETTHDFESRYLDGLIGPLPEERQRYVDRSPLTHLDNLHVPVILLQGDDDKVVPPSQPAAVAEALARKGIPHKYLLFEGEQHGFRKAENLITALEAELSFYGQVFGFDPPGVPRLQLDGGPVA